MMVILSTALLLMVQFIVSKQLKFIWILLSIRDMLTAVDIKEPLYPTIIGSIPGTDDSGLKVKDLVSKLDQSSCKKPKVSTLDAMVTCSQSRALSFQKMKPLQVLSKDGITVDREAAR